MPHAKANCRSGAEAGWLWQKALYQKEVRKMKSGTLKGVAIAGALATFMAPAVAFAGKAKAAKGVHCEGTNDCKGQSFTMAKNTKACEKKGGHVESKKM